MSFDSGYRRWRRSHTHASLLGDGYTDTIEPFSFVPFSALSEFASGLEGGPGQTLIDLGCGRGGVGLWVADQIRSDVVGVDSSQVAIADARERASEHSGHPAAGFVVADVARTGLASGCADSLMCVDVLQLMTDPGSVAGEIARLLRSGGVLGLTTWEGLDGAPSRFPRRIANLLETAGLVEVDVKEHPEWLRRQRRVYAGAMDRVSTGDADDAVADLANEGRKWESIYRLVRRVSVRARKQ